jgi:hypothetical protein
MELSPLALSDFEQHIYNTFLRISRQRKNLPYKNRKDFNNLPESDTMSLKKISMFLTKHSHIKLEDFIKAPYFIYKDETYFALDYYISLKAVKAYTLFKKQELFLEPDNDIQLNNIIDSLRYILTFCNDHNILIDHYISHNTGNMKSFILHLKEHRVNVYCLLGFSDFDRTLMQQDNDVVRFTLGEEFYDKLPYFRLKFFSSKKARTLVERGIQKIKQKNT